MSYKQAFQVYDSLKYQHYLPQLNIDENKYIKILKAILTRHDCSDIIIHHAIIYDYRKIYREFAAFELGELELILQYKRYELAKEFVNIDCRIMNEIIEYGNVDLIKYFINAGWNLNTYVRCTNMSIEKSIFLVEMGCKLLTLDKLKMLSIFMELYYTGRKYHAYKMLWDKIPADQKILDELNILYDKRPITHAPDVHFTFI